MGPDSTDLQAIDPAAPHDVASRPASVTQLRLFGPGVLTLSVTGDTERVMTKTADPVDICRLLK